MRSKIFKRFIAMVMCVLMCASMATVAFAAEPETDAQYTTTHDDSIVTLSNASAKNVVATSSTSISNSASIGSGKTVTFAIGTLSTGHTGRITLTSSGSSSKKTYSWSIFKNNQAAFMSGSTYVGNTFTQGYLYLAAGTYYITVTNNSSKTTTITATFAW